MIFLGKTQWSMVFHNTRSNITFRKLSSDCSLLWRIYACPCPQESFRLAQLQGESGMFGIGILAGILGSQNCIGNRKKIGFNMPTLGLTTNPKQNFTFAINLWVGDVLAIQILFGPYTLLVGKSSTAERCIGAASATVKFKAAHPTNNSTNVPRTSQWHCAVPFPEGVL